MSKIKAVYDTIQTWQELTDTNPIRVAVPKGWRAALLEELDAPKDSLRMIFIVGVVVVEASVSAPVVIPDGHGILPSGEWFRA